VKARRVSAPSHLGFRRVARLGAHGRSGAAPPARAPVLRGRLHCPRRLRSWRSGQDAGPDATDGPEAPLRPMGSPALGDANRSGRDGPHIDLADILRSSISGWRWETLLNPRRLARRDLVGLARGRRLLCDLGSSTRRAAAPRGRCSDPVGRGRSAQVSRSTIGNCRNLVPAGPHLCRRIPRRPRGPPRHPDRHPRGARRTGPRRPRGLPFRPHGRW
jgi:hypothetical protein